jgi:hypothetical protein
MTDWDTHWFRIREDYVNTGFDDRAAGELADQSTAEQFGPRPQEGE